MKLPLGTEVDLRGDHIALDGFPAPRKIIVKDLQQRSGLAWFCACAESCVVFNTGPYTVLSDNSILITANMQSETGYPSIKVLRRL